VAAPAVPAEELPGAPALVAVQELAAAAAEPLPAEVAAQSDALEVVPGAAEEEHSVPARLDAAVAVLDVEV
jgi:hypothetical protein